MNGGIVCTITIKLGVLDMAIRDQWNLNKGKEILGVLNEEEVDQPWIMCKFHAFSPFTIYEALFAEELRHLKSDEMEHWKRAYKKIDDLRLELKPLNKGGVTIKNFILHIDGDK